MNTNRIIISALSVAVFISGIFAVAIANKKPTSQNAEIQPNTLTGTQTTATIKQSRTGENEGSEGEDDGFMGRTVAPTPTTPKQPVSTTPTPVADKNKYKNGTYTATGSYDSPAGMEDIGVTLTLKDGIVTSSSLTLMAQDGRSQMYQQRFQSGYKSQVIGKSIDSISLGVISGSSLTPIGFNDAVAQIKSQARA